MKIICLATVISPLLPLMEICTLTQVQWDRKPIENKRQIEKLQAACLHSVDQQTAFTSIGRRIHILHITCHICKQSETYFTLSGYEAFLPES